MWMVRVPIHMLFLCPEGGYSHCGPGLCKGHAAYRVPHPHSFGLTSQGAQASSHAWTALQGGIGGMPMQGACFPETPAGMYGCRLGAGGFPSPQCRSQLARPLSPTSVAGHTRVLPRLDGASGRDWGLATGCLFSGDTSRHVRLQAGCWWFPFAPMPFATGAATFAYIRRRAHTRPPTPGRRFRAGIGVHADGAPVSGGTSKQAARCTITVLALGAGRFPSPQWPAAVSAKGAATYIRLPSPVPALGRTSTCIASRKAAALRPKARGLALLPSPPQR